jgi:hypothetical protein
MERLHLENLDLNPKSLELQQLHTSILYLCRCSSAHPTQSLPNVGLVVKSGRSGAGNDTGVGNCTLQGVAIVVGVDQNARADIEGHLGRLFESLLFI